MPCYRIFQLVEPQIAPFRERAQAPGCAELKAKHYEEVGQVEAPGPYQAWKRLREDEAQSAGIRELGVGDVLAQEDGPPLICHYWGFEEAAWADENKAQEEAAAQ